VSRKGENIYKRKDGRWEGRYIKARNEQGKIVYGYIYGRQYAQVKKRLAELKVQYSFTHTNVNLYKGTVKDWLYHWLNIVMKKRIKQSTYTSYRLRIDKYIIPFLGNKALSQLKNQDVEEFVNYLFQIDLSSATIHSVVMVLKSALKKAHLENYILMNPSLNLEISAKQTNEITALSLADQAKIETVALKEQACSAVILALYTGLRIGEISGLKWADIDFDKNIIYVKRTLYRIPSLEEKKKTEIILAEPKTKSSKRAIPLAENLKSYLLNKKKMSTSEFVISCKNGYAEPRVISYRFKQIIKEAGVPPIHFHVLRHTFATRCVERGIDIATLSKLLGHASIKLTLDTYTDSLWENRKKAVSVLDEQLRASS
jgi:integrase